MTDLDLNAAEFDQIRDILNGWGSFSIHASYSGRGMYGKTCFGVSTEYSNPSVATMALTQVLMQREGNLDSSERCYFSDVMEALDNIGTPSHDSLGYSTIYYWPEISVEEGVGSDDDN